MCTSQFWSEGNPRLIDMTSQMNRGEQICKCFVISDLLLRKVQFLTLSLVRDLVSTEIDLDPTLM